MSFVRTTASARTAAAARTAATARTTALRRIGPGWLPTQQSGCKLWLRADTGVGFQSTLLATGTSPPVATVSGTPVGTPAVRVEITTGGTLPSAVCRYSTDDGATYTSGVAISSGSVVIGSSGYTVAFPAGTYTNDNVYQGVLSTLTDSSGNGFNASTSSAGVCPIYESLAFGGQPSMKFDGVDDFMSANGAASFASGADTPMTVIVAGQKYTTGVTGHGLTFGNSANANSQHLPWRYNGADTYQVARDDNAGTAVTVSGAAANVNQHALIWVFTGTRQSFYEDNRQQTGNAYSLDVGTVTFDRLTLGALGRTTTTSFCKVRIAEVIIFDTAISDLVRNYAQAYLGNRYGIPMT